MQSLACAMSPCSIHLHVPDSRPVPLQLQFPLGSPASRAPALDGLCFAPLVPSCPEVATAAPCLLLAPGSSSSLWVPLTLPTPLLNSPFPTLFANSQLS